MTSPLGATTEPTISGIEPVNASAGTGSVVIIHGSGFGAERGAGHVDFTFKPQMGSTQGVHIPANTVTSWSDRQIVCEVPVDEVGYARSAASGPLTVTTAGGLASAPIDFKVTFGYLWRLPRPTRTFAIVTDRKSWRSMIKAAAKTWNEAGEFRIVFSTQMVRNPRRGNGFSEIYWGETTKPSTLAETWCPEELGQLPSEIDIVFNKKKWWSGWVPETFDVQSIALHEFGHVIGLRDLYGDGDKAKAMYGWMDSMGPKGSLLKWTWGRHRSLSADDIAGLRWLYPKKTALDAVAFVRDADIWTMNADGSGQRNLTSTPLLEEWSPSWSPDGSRLAYLRGNTLPELWTMRSDGVEQKRVSADWPSEDAYVKNGLADVDWSPKGDAIAFCYWIYGVPWLGARGAGTLDLATGDVTMLDASGTMGAISWHPSGAYVTIAARLMMSGPWDSQIRFFGVFNVATGAAPAPRLSFPDFPDNSDIVGAEWNSAGDLLACVVRRDSPDEHPNGSQLVLVDPAGRQVRVLADWPLWDELFTPRAFTPDGASLAVLQLGGEVPQIWTIPVGGGPAKLLLDDASDVQWQPTRAIP